MSRVKGQWLSSGYTCGYNLFLAGLSTSVLVLKPFEPSVSHIAISAAVTANEKHWNMCRRLVSDYGLMSPEMFSDSAPTLKYCTHINCH